MNSHAKHRRITESVKRQIVDLAGNSEGSPGKPWTTRRLGEKFGISASAVSKILRAREESLKKKQEEPRPELDLPPQNGDSGNCSVMMADIAAEAGVSKQTVSLALRGSESVSRATAERILAIAVEMEYRPNPYMAALMADRRRKNQKFTGAVLAMLHDADRPLDQVPVSSGLVLTQFYHAAKKEAEALGYRLELINYCMGGQGSGRLDTILKTRGIRGLYIVGKKPLPPLDWNHYVCVCSRAPQWPLYYVRSDIYHNIYMALDRLEERGYQNVAAAFDRCCYEVAYYYAAYSAYHYEHQRKMAVPFEISRDRREERFVKWVEKVRPDAVLFIWTGGPFFEFAEQYLKEKGIGLCSIGIPGEKNYLSGIETRCDARAREAIRLLNERLISNRFGLLESPRRLLIQGNWHEGDSIRTVTEECAQ